MASAAAILWPIISLTIWALYCSVCLARNYQVARKIGLPVRVIPIDHTNAVWTLLDRKVLYYIRKLPGFLGNNSFTRYNFRTWELHDRCSSHHEMGDAFIIVTPFRNWLYISNPATITEVFRRRTDFPQCIELTEILDVFGKNLGTVEGRQWQVQRKIIASCFTEQNYEVVWTESLSLAHDMLEYWTKKRDISSSADDLRTLSLHVLTGAGFGKHFPFEGHDERTETSVSGNYKNALQMILENCILIMGIGPKVLARIRPFLPKAWKLAILSETCAEFQRYMTIMYEEEKSKQADTAPVRTLMSSLVRASQVEAKTGAGLTEREIYGNMFMLNFAGHDTTAHTFTFAIHFLAAHPDVQAWVSEEIRAVHTDSQRDALNNYSVDFPRLVRCLAVMLETLRLYTPVPVAKWTDKGTASLRIGSKIALLPPNTMVIPSYAAVHTDPSIWGSDSLEWRPSRWIKANSGPPGNEELIVPSDGSFLGWSEGARNCPAKKFSQVEFVATLAILLRDWHVDIVPESGESLVDSQKRVMDLIENDSGAVLLLQMLHPERVSLVWSKST
ncbi:cytochrome P450 [Coniella lustricola]|uniref:Cytochrome P450 n=1 Tax=Coniella lustricola TaxID=2025994 RepID=A0A2T2ZY51_9PEZI|nr:cytochrome P450 [Coniella lustricola]